MLTFSQFIAEAEHSSCPYKEWGVIHPKTGKTTSGDQHPSATIHSDLKAKMIEKNPRLTKKDTKEYPEYGNAEHDRPKGYLMVRGINKNNAHAVAKSYNKLPHHYSNNVLLTGHHFYHEGSAAKGYGMLRRYASDPKAKFDRA